MSIRFKKFLERVGKETEFKPLKNRLLDKLIEESKNKYKNYPRLLDKMKQYWPKYSDRSRISHLLKDHYEEFFNFYFNTLFPFRKTGLTLEDPEAPTPVDFKLVYRYRFKKKEIDAVKEVAKDLKLDEGGGKDLDTVAEGIMKRIIIFTVSSFGPIVEQIFERPFAFQFSNIEDKSYEDGEFEVIAVMSAREQ